MKKIKHFLDYETNPVTFLLWFHHKQVVKFVRLLRDPNYKPTRLY